jgi:long-chain fatty acid transport protein
MATRAVLRARTGLAGALVFACFAGEASGSGFAIRENSAEALGTAFAGNASSATFLSTIFNNPAGMTHFTGDRAQLVGSAILPSSHFRGGGASEVCAVCPPGGAPILGNSGGNAGEAVFVPAGYVLHSFSPDFKVGLALTEPFGLETNYAGGWVGRYFGIKSEIQSLDLNPNVAYRVNEWLSLGAGVSAQYFSADLSQAIDFNSLLGVPPGSIPDGFFRVNGDDWGVGYNLGLLFEPADRTSIGIAYRSRVHHTVEGEAVFDNVAPAVSGNPVLAPAFTSRRAKVSLTTPDSLDLSITEHLTPQFHLAGDLQWTHWSLIKTLTIQGSDGTNIGSPTPENFKNTVFVSLGATYNLNETWTLRTGVAYDQSPVRDAFRTVRLPDADRYWLAFGAGYKFSDGFSVDIGYAHIFMPTTSISGSVNSTLTSPISGAKDVLTGSYSQHIDLISLQTRFRF